MGICPYNTASNFPGWSSVQTLLFSFKFTISCSRKVTVLTTWKDHNHILCQRPFKALSYIRGRLRNTSAAMNACPYYTESNFPGWSVVQNWLFCLKFESSLGRKATDFTLRGWNMVPGGFYIILILIRDVREHSRSNEHMSLWHSVRFLRLI